MPTNTDLVTDLPADFEVFGQAVDTTLADLKGGTTGQVLSKASNTDMDFTWVTDPGGDITGVTAGTGISGGGTSGTVTVTNSMATAIDAKGDLIAGTGADAFSRLAIGTNDQVLTADSTAATGMKWASPVTGSMTLLSTTTMNSGTTTQTVSGISTAYKSLKIIVRNGYANVGDFGFRFRLNGDSGTNYSYAYAGQYWAGYDGYTNLGNLVLLGNRNSASTTWSKQGYGVFEIDNYSAAGQALVQWNFINHDGGGGNTITYTGGICVYNASAAVTSFSLLMDGANFTGGTILVYGVN